MSQPPDSCCLAPRGSYPSVSVSGPWSSQPNTIKLDELDVICAVLGCSAALGCSVGELLVSEPEAVSESATNQSTGAVAHARAVTPRSRTGRSLSPDDRRSTPRWPPSRSQPLTPAVHQICRPPAVRPGRLDPPGRAGSSASRPRSWPPRRPKTARSPSTSREGAEDDRQDGPRRGGGGRRWYSEPVSASMRAGMSSLPQPIATLSRH